jgi:hypothetical protein
MKKTVYDSITGGRCAAARFADTEDFLIKISTELRELMLILLSSTVLTLHRGG